MGKARAVLGIVFVGTLLACSLAGAVYTARSAKIVPTPEAPALPEPGRPRPKPYILPMQYAEWVIRYCDENGTPIWIVSRLFAWESGWNPKYKSLRNDNGTHDYGLAALNSAYLGHFSIYNDGMGVDPLDAETAIRVGVRYLAALYAETRTWEGAVGSYNVGLIAWKAGKRPSRHIRAILGGP